MHDGVLWHKEMERNMQACRADAMKKHLPFLCVLAGESAAYLIVFKNNLQKCLTQHDISVIKHIEQ